jgi:ABC-type transporter Mla MlaB component
MSFGGVASLVLVMRRESHAVAAALHPPHGPRTVVLMIDAPLTADTVAALCDRVRAALRGADVDLVTCDIRWLTAPDVGVLDALARLQLTARHAGSSIRLRAVSADLSDLLELAGLRGALPCAS